VIDTTGSPSPRAPALLPAAALALLALAGAAAGCRTDLPPLSAEPPTRAGVLLPPPPEGGYDLARPYPLLTGDTITISVLDKPDLNYSVTIDSTGRFELYDSELADGRRQVIDTRGRTVEDLVKEITEAYGRKFAGKTPYVQVRLSNPAPRRVFIRGAVKTALSEKSIVDLPPNRRMTLYQCIQSSGVLDEDADLSRVQISRKDPATGAEVSLPTYDLKEMDDTLSYDRDPPLEPGDIVIVPTFGQVSIFGHVNETGTFRCERDMTLTQLVTRAKGLKPFAKKSDVRVIRILGKGVEQTFTVDLGAIFEGRLYDPRMQPGDRVWIDESWN
jgi:protein involved in polysaccharide export with SLBB domain